MPTFPLTLPPEPGFSRVNFRPRAIVGMTISRFTGQQRIQQHHELWFVDLNIAKMKRAEAEAWTAAFLLLSGRANTFLLGDPAGKTPRGSVPGTPLVDGAAQTGRTLNTKGWTASQTGILVAGDWVQVGSGSIQRLYKVTEDANSDGAGLAALSIWPSLRESPADAETLVTSNCEGVFRLASNEMEWGIAADLFYEMSFQAMEAI